MISCFQLLWEWHSKLLPCCYPGWWYKPDYIINDININSVIASPAHEEVIALSGKNASITLAGYAYSGAHALPMFHNNIVKIFTCALSAACNHGWTCMSQPSACWRGPWAALHSQIRKESMPGAGAGRKIIRCEVSVDGCKTWRLGDIQRAGPPNAYGKHWAWVFWSIKVPLSALSILCRALHTAFLDLNAVGGSPLCTCCADLARMRGVHAQLLCCTARSRLAEV